MKAKGKTKRVLYVKGTETFMEATVVILNVA